jgi:hypothetical protein
MVAATERMTATKLKILCAAITGFVISSHLNAYADEATPKLKSVGVAVALGLDPLPADALFYAGKPVQGSIDLIIGMGGGFLTGLYVSSCGGNEDCGPGAGSLLVGGVVIYFSALIWDGIGGIAGVKSHNEKVRNRRSSIWNTVQPSVAVTNEGMFIGGQFRF